jgi:uncharacterized membrane protein YraQ (UPF0718 family)
MRNNPYLVNLILFACFDIIFTFLLFHLFGDIVSTIIYVVGIILASGCVGFWTRLFVEHNNKKKAVDEFNKAMQELGEKIKEEELEEIKKNLFEE